MADVSYSRIPDEVTQRWRVVRDVCTGDQALRKDTYLPVINKSDHSIGNAERNIAYRARAVLMNATSFTLSGMVGLAFRRDPVYGLPSQLEYLLKDADGAGVSIYQQSQATLRDVVQIGRHGLYVDFSSALKRPTIKSYRAEDIINWRHKPIGGKTVLTLLVLHEDAEVVEDYETKTVDQWRELFLNENGLCACRVWRKDKDGKPQIIQIEDADGVLQDEIVLRSSGAPLDFIPFAFAGSQNNDANIDESPLYGLAQVNVAHFRNSADYEDSVFYVGQVQPWMSGLDIEWRDHLEKSESMYIGSRAPLMLPMGGAFGFAQAQPNMLAKEAMDHKEVQMVGLGARLIEKQGGNPITATQANGEREASTSILSMCCTNVSEAYQAVIRWCARYLDITVDEKTPFKLNQDFAALPNDPAVLTAMVNAWQQGVIGKNDARDWLRRSGMIEADRTDEDIDAELLKNPWVDPEAESGELEAKEAASKEVVAAAAPVQDLTPILNALTALAAKEAPAPVINIPPMPAPVITVNVPEQPAPVVNNTVNTPDIHLAPTTVNFEPGSMVMPSSPVTVEGSTLNVPEQKLPEPWAKVNFVFNNDGEIVGATRE